MLVHHETARHRDVTDVALRGVSTVPLAKSDVGHLIELARTQAGTPGGWSLATDAGWLGPTYCAPGVATRLWKHVVVLVLIVAGWFVLRGRSRR
jgi:hypothetical protein